MTSPEPWLRGTHAEIDAIQRQVIHALELTAEDITHWCATLSDAELNARPYGLPPIAFHLRHIVRSLDRLLSYADGAQLDATQLAALASEINPDASASALRHEFNAGIASAIRRVLAFTPGQYNQPRAVGRAHLPSTVGGLLVHCAEHTQRHTGQAITSAKLLLALRSPANPS